MGSEALRNPYVCEEFGRCFLQKSHFRSDMTRLHGSLLKRSCRPCQRTMVDDVHVPVWNESDCLKDKDSIPRAEVCYEVFQYYDQYLDRTIAMYSRSHKLPVLFAQLTAQIKCYINFCLTMSFTQSHYAGYYNHMTKVESLTEVLEASRMCHIFNSEHKFILYCPIHNSFGVLSEGWVRASLSLSVTPLVIVERRNVRVNETGVYRCPLQLMTNLSSDAGVRRVFLIHSNRHSYRIETLHCEVIKAAQDHPVVVFQRGMQSFCHEQARKTRRSSHCAR